MSGTGHSFRYVVATGNAAIDGMLSGYAWNDGTITYSFPSFDEYGYGDEALSFSPVSLAVQQTTAFALDADYGSSANDGFSVEGFTGVTIAQTFSTHANLRLGYSNDPSTAWAYYPGSGSWSGDIWLGQDPDLQTPVAGTWGWAAILHEIGHALGLKHPHQVERTLYASFPTMPYNYDAMEYSIMSYKSFVGDTARGYRNETFGFAQTYMMLDIAALQQMYGADYSTNSGDTVYSWTPGDGTTYVDGSAAISPGANRIFATIWDGGGIDTYDLSAYATGLRINLNPGGSSKFSDAQTAYLGAGHFATGNIYNALLFQGNTQSLIENAIGGSGADNIVGNQADNTLWGGNGKDVLKGKFGWDVLFGGMDNDKLFGGDGQDLLDGGAGVNMFFGGAGLDTVTYENDSAAVVTNLANSLRNDGEARGDTFNSIENLIGSSFDDMLFGSGVANQLFGGDGADTLTGKGGNDELYGGDGDDVLNGGRGLDGFDGGFGFDLVDYSGFNSGVQVHLGAGIGTAGAATGETYVSIEAVSGTAFADVLMGSNEDNLISGNAGNDDIGGFDGNDTIFGGAGDDSIDAGDGNDVLSGGAGRDTFHFASTLDQMNNIDTITDFSVGEDLIAVASSFMSALGSTIGQLGSLNFLASASGSATTASEVILYNTTTGALVYDDDGNGAGAGVQFATLAAGLSLTASDFIVI